MSLIEEILNRESEDMEKDYLYIKNVIIREGKLSNFFVNINASNLLSNEENVNKVLKRIFDEIQKNCYIRIEKDIDYCFIPAITWYSIEIDPEENEAVSVIFPEKEEIKKVNVFKKILKKLKGGI